MSSATKTDPSVVLNQLFIGSSVCGVRFGATQLLFSPSSGSGELFVNLSSAFQIFESSPEVLPGSESDVPDLSQEEEMLTLFALRGFEVEKVAIAAPDGHFVMTFKNGMVLYVNGNNEGPEPWHAGLNAFNRAESSWVIAISGGQSLVYAPHDG